MKNRIYLLVANMKPNFNGKHLVISANYPREPYFYTELIDKTYDCNQNCNFHNHRITNGFDFELISTLSKYFNFTWSTIYANNIWGIKSSNGTWNGMIGDVYEGRADFALGDLSSTYERSLVVDFTTPYLYTPITFLIRNQLKLSDMAMFRPFDNSVWITIFVTFIISSFLMHICLILTDCKSGIDYKFNNPVHLEVYWIPFDSLLLKCSRRSLIRANFFLRLYNIVWQFTSIILWVVYTTYLLNMMTSMQDNQRISSIEQLVKEVEDNKIRICTWAESPMAPSITKNLQIRSIDKALENFPMFIAFELMLTSAKNLVSISTEVRLRTFMKLFGEKYFNLLSSHETSFATDFISIALPKNSSITKHFSKVISSLQTTGHFISWINSATDAVLKEPSVKNRFNISNLKFETQDIEIEDEIKLKHLSFVVNIFSLGLCTALFVLIIETFILMKNLILKKNSKLLNVN